MIQGRAGEGQAVEREYIEHRSMVLDMLGASFSGVPDHEELYQEAWAEALELQARGEDLDNVGMLLKTIAWRRACDRVRKHQPAPIDPSSWLFANQSDPEALPEEQVEVRLDAALIRQVVDTLGPREAAVIKLRFDCHLDSAEIQQRLGVTAKRLEKIVTRAYRRVEQALSEDESGISQWRRRQQSLLLACESGHASADQRREATLLVRDDPVCRAMLHDIRSTLDRVAAILPLPLLISQSAYSRLARVRLGITDRFAGMRDQVADLAAKVTGHSPTIEQAGAGSAISATGGLAIKAALVCVAATGTTVVCLSTGVFSGSADRPAQRPVPVASSRAKEPMPPRQVHVAPVVVRAPVTHKQRQVHRRVVAQPATAPPPSPAPRGSTEFGPGAVGSSAAPSQPAAVPASSSSSSSSSSSEFLP